MYLFDSDHLSLLWHGEDVAFKNLESRLVGLPEIQFFVPIVSVDEQLRGWLAFLNRRITPDQLVLGYAELHQLLNKFAISQIADFTEAASDVFIELRKDRIRVSTMDLRIASIAIANNMVLLTRNTVDFERVPGLQFEDWTVTHS